MANHWLFKSEPSEYAFERLTRERQTLWTGIRNFQARNNLRAMKPGELALFYHTGTQRQVVGVARVAKPAVEDPTAKGEDWSAVALEPVAALAAPVTLAQLRADPALADFPILKQGRLSVAGITAAQFRRVLALGKTAVPR